MQKKGSSTYTILVQAKCVRTNIVHALADVVATKLGIILLSSSFHLLFSQKGFAYDFELLHAFLLVTTKIRFSTKEMGERVFLSGGGDGGTQYRIHPPPL